MFIYPSFNWRCSLIKSNYNMENTLSESALLKEKVNRSLLYVGIFSILMLFAGLTSAYIVRQADGNWLEFSMPFMFWISTGLILLSSAAMNWALLSARNSRYGAIKVALMLTLALGIAFCFTQFLAWKELVAGGIFFSGKTANPSGSFMYILSGLHLAHIFSGLLYILVILFKSFNNRYNSRNLMGIKHCSIYWHFLDALWIYLFVFLLFMQ